MKKVAITFALAAFITAGMQEMSFAQGIGNQNKHQVNSQKFNQKVGLRQKLNLTDEQSQRAKEIRQQSRAKIQPIVNELKAERTKLREMRQTGATQEEIEKQRQKIQELMTKAKEIHRQNLDSFEQILNTEQKTQFKEIKKERMEKLKGMKKQRMQEFKGEKQNIKQEYKNNKF